jgi:hypothetical protein
MGEWRGVDMVLVGKSKEKVHLGDPVIDGRIILSWIFGKLLVGVWNESSCLRISTGGKDL